MIKSNSRRRKPPFLFKVKMDKIKEVFVHYTVWGVFLALITLLIRQFVSIRQTLRDATITFLVSMLSGLLLEYFNTPDPVKYGISGVCGLFAVRIYLIMDSLLRQAENDPLGFIKKVRGNDDKH